MVAGSKTVHCCVVPGVRPSAARRRPRLSISAGGSISCARFGACPRRAADLERERQAVEAALDRPSGRCRDRARSRTTCSANARSTCAVVFRIAAVVRAEQRELQAAVFLQLEAIVGGLHLADGEADLLAAVVHAAPLRGRAVARKIGGEVAGRRLKIGAIDHHAHRRDPRDQREERERARDGARQRAKNLDGTVGVVIGRRSISDYRDLGRDQACLSASGPGSPPRGLRRGGVVVTTNVAI